MENDSGVLILLIVLIVSAFLLAVLKLAQFVGNFSRKKQRLLTEMGRAADYNEYSYWLRGLRCLYLCLIPFVTERNVMKIYPAFFRREKRKAKEKRQNGLMRIIAPSVMGICICAVCLCNVSWAWLTASTSIETTEIKSSFYKLFYQIGSDAAELAQTDNTYTLTSDTTVITLKAAGTAGATGYCIIRVGNETYYTEQIFVNDTSEFTFTVNAAAGTKIKLNPKWGNYSGTATIQNGDVIAVNGTQQSNTQAPDNRIDAESVDQAAPSSNPAESATTAPEPLATAPAATQPEPTDTEPTPAPEDTTAPANTDKTE